MTFAESEFYPFIEDLMREDKLIPVFPLSQPSLEDFMREDKLPPVFPLSQPSLEDATREDKLPLDSETQNYNYNFISEVCDPLWSSPSHSPIHSPIHSLSFSPSSSPSFSPSSSPISSPSSSPISSPSSESNNNSVNSDDPIVKKQPATRGRKRKLFTNCEQKKKAQNKEAARRYREKKKSEDCKLEIEEAQLISEQKRLRRELDSLSRTHREFVLLAKDFLAEERRKKMDLQMELNQLLESLN